MIVKYIRVSTVEQNLDRQEADFKGKIYKDEVSGSIAFKERTEASKLILNKDITETIIAMSFAF